MIWNHKFVDFLLRHGTDPNARDFAGNTPLSTAISLENSGWLLDTAIRRGHEDIAELLRDALERKHVAS
ncbi:uncharacterized protein BDZ83DRAFT_621909 [Colletotrichum acutatum]|uniref:Ankyrin repeat protein n=1 Tax=Glomerella acutata TaxID=27357 RepID=A0AAD8XFV5_GLOAC|nr:uncharacterized protein BDZ83DRAFT_621909 [Colletotrichum acutatum]KAK1724786.1 hypothetical protein BDZ83DRAFT_621909 [Colletotrichum acutatum]